MQYFLTQWTFPQDFKTFYVSIQIDTASVHLRLDTEKNACGVSNKSCSQKTHAEKKHSILKKKKKINQQI